MKAQSMRDTSNVLQSLRLEKLAKALGMEPPPEGLGLRIEQGSDRRWWLCGCAEGDCALPRSKGQPTVAGALEAAESWMVPELVEVEDEMA